MFGEFLRVSFLSLCAASSSIGIKQTSLISLSSTSSLYLLPFLFIFPYIHNFVHLIDVVVHRRGMGQAAGAAAAGMQSAFGAMGQQVQQAAAQAAAKAAVNEVSNQFAAAFGGGRRK